MSFESRFDPPGTRDEPNPITYCNVCGESIYGGDKAYRFDVEVYCDRCGLDYLQDLHRITVDKEDF